MNEDCCCIIPARGGSTRIKGKNKRKFFGIPMVERAILLAKVSELFDRIIVSSDDDEILEIADQHGVETHRRSARMSSNEVGTQAVTAYVIKEKRVGNIATCCLYPCVPLLLPDDLNNAYDILMIKPCNYVVAVATDPLRDIGNFYFGRTECFNNNPLYGLHTGLYVLEDRQAIDINTEEDWKLAESKYMALAREEFLEQVVVDGGLH